MGAQAPGALWATVAVDKRGRGRSCPGGWREAEEPGQDLAAWPPRGSAAGAWLLLRAPRATPLPEAGGVYLEGQFGCALTACYSLTTCCLF